jgi:hypothetical protein
VTTARCSCGSVQVRVSGEPLGVVACHCLACQRRTGSVFGVGAYYPAERVTVTGELRDYARGTDAGHTFTSRFCPRCGTSVLWSSGKNPGLVGIAVGAVADPRFPAPDRSVWEESRHAWVDLGHVAEHFPKGRGA